MLRCSIKTFFLKFFAKLTGKSLSQSLFFNKVAGLKLVKNIGMIKRLSNCQLPETQANLLDNVLHFGSAPTNINYKLCNFCNFVTSNFKNKEVTDEVLYHK